MPSNKNALLRYRTIDKLLCGEEWHTVEDIIKACEEALSGESDKPAKVSRVTFYKDLEDIQSIYEGIRVEKTQGRPVKYRYARDSKTINGTVIPSESYSDLSYALEYLESVSGMVNVDGTVRRIRKKLELEGHEMAQIMSYDTNRLLHNSDLLRDLYRYIREDTALTFRYNAAYSLIQEVEFQPWYLKQYNNRWFVIGWTYKVTDSEKGTRVNLFRTYAVDRIVTEGGEKPRPCRLRMSTGLLKLNKPGTEGYIDFDEYYSDIIGVTKKAGEQPVEIELRGDAQDINACRDWHRMVTKPIHRSQTSSSDEKWLHVKFCVIPNNEMYTTLMGYEHLEVVGPEEVRNEMKRRIRLLISHYE